MVTVCVLGGGTAGTEAAVEAARCGAEVTLLERSSHPPLPRTLWSRMLDGEVTQPRRSHLLSTLRVEVVFGFAARSLGSDHRVYGSESSARFDSVVIATGSRSKAVLFAGSNKSGVHILADATDYLELAARQDSIERLVVTGSGLPVFEVAERLNRHGTAVTVLGRGHTPGLCREIGELLDMRAAQCGVKVSGARLQKAVGSGPLEAVVAGGKIVPCDALAVIPPFCPDYPPGSQRSGPEGGVSVDESMRTSEPGVFAAGSCAEMATAEGGSSVLLGSSASASGRVAGANAAGRKVILSAAATFSAELFGLCLEGAGLTFDLARKAGLEVVETVKADGPTSVCSLVHDRATGRLVGGQIAGTACRGVSGLIASAVSHRLDIGSLAYADLGSSTDISMLQDTARQGLTWR